MRLILFSCLLIIASCSQSKKTAIVTPPSLNGSWIPVRQEMSGKEMPAAFYAKQKLVILDSTYTMIAESLDKGVVRISGNRIDIFGKEGVNKGRHFTGLFLYEKGILTICYNLKGDSYPDNMETRGKPLYFLSVFTREPGS